MDFPQQLSIFVAVADNGSFSRAAEGLRMPRPSVTNAINALEAALGARLLQRTTRRTSLTAEGERLYDRATRLLTDISETRNLFGASSVAPRGRLRVDIPVALARPLIIHRIAEFRALYPEVDVILGVSDQPVDLLADGVDCVLRIGELAPTSMIARKLATMTIVVCGSPDYLEAHGTPGTVEDLRQHQAVNYFSGRGYRPIAWSMPEDAGIPQFNLRSGIMVNDTEAFVACALNGLGLIQVPGLVVAEHLASGKLVEVVRAMRTILWPLSIMYPNRQHLAPQVRVFIDWVAEIVASSTDEWLRPVGGKAYTRAAARGGPDGRRDRRSRDLKDP
ncbi:LysR family transcriptional regulator [Sphingobium sp. SCG-1]|uniref:LysR family transcriptional regulator n=1 Tax=Sphingobium sp. SCG-1 TaxID=2072936 RepID=UPI000CD6A1C5|nr:LysR family transcriptional regulator [Sphingobium sp. SCG-1]AUW58953.1 LysR family transcriptional regulator [Sphingobium sp. SCG-1]